MVNRSFWGLSLAFASVIVLLGALSLPAQADIVRPIQFPLTGPHTFRNDYSEPRGGGTREHLGIDIISQKMTPVVAATDGFIEYIVIPEASWGYSLTIQDAEGYQYRYLHLNNDTPGTDDGLGGVANAYAPGIARGVKVTKGQVIGWVGDSGNAEDVGSHLHFEIRLPGDDHVATNPYQSLLAADNGSIVVAPTITPTTSTLVSTASILASTTSSIGSTSIPVTSSGPKYIFTKLIITGMQNEDVRQLQIKLKTLGHFTYPEITGYFGAVTRASVISFQRSQGIDPLGHVGPMTRAALNGL
jgi:hypothetical protein